MTQPYSHQNYLRKFANSPATASTALRDAPSPGTYRTAKLASSNKARLENFIQRHKPSLYSPSEEPQSRPSLTPSKSQVNFQDDKSAEDLYKSIQRLDNKLENIKGKFSISDDSVISSQDHSFSQRSFTPQPVIDTTPRRRMNSYTPDVNYEIRDIMNYIDNQISYINENSSGSYSAAMSLKKAREKLEYLESASRNLSEKKRDIDKHESYSRKVSQNRLRNYSNLEEFEDLREVLRDSEAKLQREISSVFNQAKSLVQNSRRRPNLSDLRDEFSTPMFSPSSTSPMTASPTGASADEGLRFLAKELETKTIHLLNEEKEFKFRVEEVEVSLMELTRRKQLADRKMELHKKKEQEIRNSVIELQDKVNSSKKQLGLSVCKEIVYETVALAMIESQDRKKLTLANRENAARVANDKMYKTLAKTERIKRQLEQEALKILQLKNQLSAQTGTLLASSIKETRTIPDNRPDLAFKKKEEALRKREITFNDRLKQLQQLELQASEKEKEILRREKMLQAQTRSLTPEPVLKPLNDDFKLKEKSLKSKEEELIRIDKMLKEEEDRLEAERIAVNGLYDKMMAQIDNIQKQESKAERSRNEIKSQTQDYIQKKTQEEEKLIKWEKSLNDSEVNIEKLRAKAEKYEKELHEREVRLSERMQLLDSKLKQKQEEAHHSPEVSKHHESWDSDSEISSFAENFMRRQQKWREECEEISKEKLELTRTLNEVLSELS